MLELREIERGDAPEISRWRNRKDPADCLGDPFCDIGSEVDDAWFDDYLSSRGSTVRFAVINDDEPGKIAGLVLLTSVDRVARSCALRVTTCREQDRGESIAAFALNAMAFHAFRNLGLHRIELEVLATSERTVSLCKNLGFRFEGVKREARFENGTYVDVNCMALLDREWSPSTAGALKVTSRNQVESVWEKLRYEYEPPLMEDLDFQRYMDKVAAFGITYVYLEDGESTGAISLYANDLERRTSFITQIAVKPDQSGRGIGRALLEKAFRESKRRGMRQIELEVKKDNVRARRLYESCNFSIVGEGADSFMMKRSLFGTATSERACKGGSIERQGL